MAGANRLSLTDSVAAAKKKVALAVGGDADAGDICLWSECRCVSPSSSPHFARQLARRILAPLYSLSTEEAAANVDHLFPGTGPAAAQAFGACRDGVVNTAAVTRFLQQHVKRNTIMEHMGHVWVADAEDDDDAPPQLLVKCCNPFDDPRIDRLALAGACVPESIDSVTLQTRLCMEGTDQQPVTIHFAYKKDVLAWVKQRVARTDEEGSDDNWQAGFVDLYFVPVRETSGKAVAYDRLVSDIRSEVMSSIGMSASIRIAFYHVKVEPAASAHSMVTVPLFEVFSNFHTSEAVPVVFFKNDQNPLSKIHRRSLAQIAESDQLIRWLQKKQVSQTMSYLVFYIRVPIQTGGRSVFCNLIMYDTMRYDVIITCPKYSTMGTPEDIQMVLRAVQPIVKHIRSQLAVGSMLPDIDMRHIWGHSPRGSSTALVTLNVYATLSHAKQRMPKHGQIKDAARSLLRNEFEVLDQSGKETPNIVLQYKKVDNYDNLSEIHYFIREHAFMNTWALVQRVSRNFKLSIEDSQQQLLTFFTKRAAARRTSKILGLREDTLLTMLMRVSPTRASVYLRIQGLSGKAVMTDLVQSVMFVLAVASSSGLRKRLVKAQELVTSVADERGRPSAAAVPTLAPLPHTPTAYSFVKAISSGVASQPESTESLASFLDASADDNRDLADAEPDAELDAELDAEPDAGRDSRAQIDELVKHDPLLFAFKKRGYHSYAQQCGKVDERQPIVLDKEQQDRVNPTGYGEAVLYGSDRSNMRYYACPDVWCPKSKLAMTYDQFENAGRKCPIDEVATLFENRYWSGRKKTRHIGFLDASKHPRGLCMPCCFKSRGKRVARCSGAAEAPDDQEDSRVKYVKNDDMRVLQDGRLSLLPKALLRLFGGSARNVCGSRPDGSGPLQENASCIARIGMPNNGADNSFGRMLAKVTGNHNIVNEIADGIDVPTFVTLQDGAVYRDFCKEAVRSRDMDLYADFAQYVKSSPKEFHGSVAAAVSRHKSFSWKRMGIDDASQVMRAYVVYRGAMDFRQAILSGKVDHHTMLDAIQKTVGVNMVVVELVRSDSGDELYASFPACGIQHDADFHASTCIDGQYEPIVTVVTRSKNMVVEMDATFNASKDPRATDFLRMQDRVKRSGDAVVKLVAGLTDTLRQVNVDATHLLLSCRDDYQDLSACGLRLIDRSDTNKAPLLLPFTVPLPLACCHDIGWVFLDEAVFDPARGSSGGKRGPWTPAQVSRLLQHIRTATGDEGFAPLDKIVAKPGGDMVVAMTLLAPNAPFPIPLAPTSSMPAWLLDHYRRGRDAVGAPAPTDPVVLKAQLRLEMDAMLDNYVMLTFEMLEDDEMLMQELRFLKSDFNPFSDSVRRTRARDLVSQAIASRPDIVDIIRVPKSFHAQFVDRLTLSMFDGVVQQARAENDVVHQRTHSPDEILLTETDVQKLRQMGALTHGGIMAIARDMANA